VILDRSPDAEAVVVDASASELASASEDDSDAKPTIATTVPGTENEHGATGQNLVEAAYPNPLAASLNSRKHSWRLSFSRSRGRKASPASLFQELDSTFDKAERHKARDATTLTNGNVDAVKSQHVAVWHNVNQHGDQLAPTCSSAVTL
jgi:hypothetical protein